MAEKKKGRKRKEDFPGSKEEVDKPSSVEYDIAKWLRSNIPTKKTKFLNHHVEYFLGSKAVDGLLTSKWANGDNRMFNERSEITEFLNEMLVHKFFHRAKKVPVSEQELKGRSKKKDGDKIDKDEPKKKDEGTADSQNEGKEIKKDGEGGKEKEQQRKKRKIRLDMHMDQVFVDAPEAYVWIYDPIPFYYWIIGTLLVLGAIGICMFPLWPPSVRKGVYYLSVAAAVFLVLIIALTTLRLVVFCLVWTLSLTRHHLWLLPNLTEDVGFFASFWPLYQYEYKGGDSKSGSEKSKKGKKKKDKCSDDEGQSQPLLTKESSSPTTTKKRQNVSGKDSSAEAERNDKGDSQNEDTTHPNQDNTEESESEGSQRSSTGKDFEIVDEQDVDTS